MSEASTFRRASSKSGAVDPHVGQARLALHHRGGVDHREDLLGDQPQRQHVALRRPRSGLAAGVHGRVEERLLVRQHLPFEPHLHGPGAQPGVELLVDPDRALVELAASSGPDGAKSTTQASRPSRRVRAAQAVAVLLREVDLQRQRRRLLGLDQRDLGEGLAAPFDAVDVERLPGPVGAGLRIEEERPLERRLDRLRSRRRLEAQRRRVGGAVVLEPPVLGVLERLQAAEDLLDRDLALGRDGDLLLDPLALGGRRAVEPEHGHPSGRAHPQHERAAGHLAAGRRHLLAADREPHRPAELRLAEAERQVLGARRARGRSPAARDPCRARRSRPLGRRRGRSRDPRRGRR